MQDKSTNFEDHDVDVGRGFDRRLAQGRRRVSFNPEKKTPEMRILEQQYAVYRPCPYHRIHMGSITSFDVYDCNKMPRKSYYPHNEPILTPVAPKRASIAHFSNLGNLSYPLAF